jgi:alginate O-acetyltransferase complex protein AlgI
VIFGTYWFAAFCCVFFPGYWLLFFSRALRQGWLLLGCFLFHYHFAGPAGVFPIIILSLFTFAMALSRRGPLIVLAIVVNVCALSFYKYFHFLALHVLGWATPGWGAWIDQGGTALLPGAPPLAISFFIFELVHYLYDVKNGNAPLRNIADYASFIFYFPSLVAGPIKRYENFLPELDSGLGSVSRQQVMEGLLRIARGYFLKIVLADFLTGFIGYYEPGFDVLQMPMRWIVFLCLGLRIWFDFSGYSEIAIGLALMMGIKLPENFNWPYAALSIRDFWHRWHISLSSWVRDYIYIPLGGSRVGLPRKILNGIIAFALCGLWHGPAWHFVVWGLYHGLGLAVCSNYRALCGRPGDTIHRFLETNPLLSWLITFLFVMFGWVFFFYPVHLALHFLYLLVAKLQFRMVKPFLIALVCAVVLGKFPSLWQSPGRMFRRFVPTLGPLQPSFLFMGALAGFFLCCVAGKYPQNHNIYRNFLRFHEGINPETAFYPTASQVMAVADSTLPKDKIIVVVGGDSVFLGLRQNVNEVWTIELQKQLGDRFAIFNVGMPDGSPTGIGAVTFEMLAKNHPRIIYAFSQLPMYRVEIDGGITYRYFFWEAYYKGLIDLSPDRRREMEQCRSAEMKNPDGQELHIGTFLDSYVNANDLWTWFGYQAIWTVWSDRTALTPFRARKHYRDEHKAPEFPGSNPYLNPQADKPVNNRFKNMVAFHGSTITGDPIKWIPILDSELSIVPSSFRTQTIGCLHWLCPWTADAMTPDEIAAQEFCYDSIHQTLMTDGYRVMEYGKNYPGEEYADGSHLDATGGRHLARQLAPVILEIARSRRYLDSPP